MPTAPSSTRVVPLICEGDDNQDIRHAAFGDCSICLHPLEEPACLPCGHVYCSDCLQAYVDTHRRLGPTSTCPTCRNTFYVGNPDQSLHSNSIPGVRRIYLDTSGITNLRNDFASAQRKIARLEADRRERDEKMKKPLEGTWSVAGAFKFWQRGRIRSLLWGIPASLFLLAFLVFATWHAMQRASLQLRRQVEENAKIIDLLEKRNMEMAEAHRKIQSGRFGAIQLCLLVVIFATLHVKGTTILRVGAISINLGYVAAAMAVLIFVMNA